jgi:hypothetical protein
MTQERERLQQQQQHGVATIAAAATLRQAFADSKRTTVQPRRSRSQLAKAAPAEELALHVPANKVRRYQRTLSFCIGAAAAATFARGSRSSVPAAILYHGLPHPAATVMHACKDRPRPSRPPLRPATSWGGGEERQLHGNVWVACSPEPRQSARAAAAPRCGRRRPRLTELFLLTRWPHVQTTGCRPRHVWEY